MSLKEHNQPHKSNSNHKLANAPMKLNRHDDSRKDTIPENRTPRKEVVDSPPTPVAPSQTSTRAFSLQAYTKMELPTHCLLPSGEGFAPGF